jgi:tetratricopeptide (TPR) repeat protein
MPTAKKPPNAKAWIPVTAEDVARKRNRIVMKVAAGVVAILVAGGLVYKHSTDQLEAQQSYDAGVRLFNSASYQQAVLTFNRAISLKSGFVEAYRMRARSYRGDGDQDSAIRDFSKVLDLTPQDKSALVERAQIYLNEKAFPKAIADATKALELDAKLAAAYNLRGTALRETGNSRSAVEDFTKALQVDPSLDNYFQRASTYQLLGEQEKAIADFNEAIAIAPDQPHVYFARAKSKAAMGDTKGSDEDYQKGRKLDGF